MAVLSVVVAVWVAAGCLRKPPACRRLLAAVLGSALLCAGCGGSLPGAVLTHKGDASSGKTTETGERKRSDTEYFIDRAKEAMAESAAEKAEAAEESRSAGEGKTVKIGSVKDLQKFCERVNGGEPAVDAELTCDLDLSEVCGEGTSNWVPIQKYNGTFEGNGHTLSGLYYADGTDEHVGFFASLDKDAVVQNLKLADVRISGTDAAKNVGALAGYSQGSVIGCEVSGSVSGASGNVGGIVGRETGSYEAGKTRELSGCVNRAAVRSDGGTECGAGGLAGLAEEGVSVSGCRNEGAVSGTAAGIGGLLGQVEGTHNEMRLVITDCVNEADIDGDMYTGGLCGNAFYCTLNRCKNTGSVTSYSFLGGLCGSFGGEHGKGRTFTSLVENCSNTGTLTLKYMENGDTHSSPGSDSREEDQTVSGLANDAAAALILNSRSSGDIICDTGKNHMNLAAGYFVTGQYYGYQGDRNLVINCVNTGTVTLPQGDQFIENSRTAIGMDEAAAGAYTAALFFGDAVREKLEPTAGEAFADGTVLSRLSAFPDGIPENILSSLEDCGLEYEVCGWKQGADGTPVLEWEE